MRKTIFFSAIVAALMFGFSFAIAPLYNAFCKKTGLNIATRISTAPDISRDISIQFISTNNKQLPWEFYPRTTSLIVHPDEVMKVIFFAKNTTQKTMTVQAIPSFTPILAANYFHKIQCFCFNKQTLKAGESIEMPMIFRIDKKIPSDVQTITLAYTLFEVTRTIK